jgi:hypothetical protein
MILILTSCNFFFRKLSSKNSKVKRADLERRNLGMGDGPKSFSRVRTSEDKMRRKDWYSYVRTVCHTQAVICKRVQPRGGETL